MGWSKPQEVTDAICEALKRNFVFKGIPESLLLEVRPYGEHDNWSPERAAHLLVWAG